MPIIIAVIFGLLGLFAIATGVGSIIMRYRMSSNMIEAGVVRGSKATIQLYVIALGAVQIAVGVLLLGLGFVLPERADQLQIDSVIVAVILRMGAWSTIVTALMLVLGAVGCIVGILQIRNYLHKRARVDRIGQQSLPKQSIIVSSIVILAFGLVTFAGGAVLFVYMTVY
ncbi:hypothetical protein [Microbacterium sp. K24]|uniref:hypothetical protein n=1 Tax=Microbacterium sp. K24 TaxID=2305446 RepID=UPI00109C0174|nr:hypothetical protein [Microbacterium sp. K24]